MKIIHLADVHLGMELDPGFSWSRERGEEIWEQFRRVLSLVREEKPEFLLIAGDLFHRQPLLRELKEVNSLFGSVPETTVVLMAGNHDYLRKDSSYRNFSWAENVIFLGENEVTCVEVPEKNTAVYGLSYGQKEILEPLYQKAVPEGKMRYHLLVAHGGDDRHIPFDIRQMQNAGFDYIACGHIHKPGILVPGCMAYAGALEPTDLTQEGQHGFFRVTVDERGTRMTFVPFAKYEYVRVPLKVTEETTEYLLEQRLMEALSRLGKGKMATVVLQGVREPLQEFDQKRLMACGRVIRVEDQTRLAFDREVWKQKYRGSLIGRYLETMEQMEGETARRAMDLGLEALMEARKKT